MNKKIDIWNIKSLIINNFQITNIIEYNKILIIHYILTINYQLISELTNHY
jgi:hypothetical protein